MKKDFFDLKHMEDEFFDSPYRCCFNNPMASDFGNWVANRLSKQVFLGLEPRQNRSHDLVYRQLKVEVKTIRAIKYRGKPIGDELLCNDFLSRALKGKGMNTSLQGMDSVGVSHSLSNSNFQAIKPKRFDFMLGFLVFLDVIRVYIVPSNHISTAVTSNDGMIRLSRMHDNLVEGVLSLCNIKNYLAFDLCDPIEMIRPRDLDSYIDRYFAI